MRALLLACSLALAAGCVEEASAPEDVAANEPAAPDAGASGPQADPLPPAPEGPPQVTSDIDWEAARADRSKSDVTAPNVTVQSAPGVDGPPPVPMLLPSGIVQPQNARPPTIVTTDDGYFATYQTPRYDAVVNGSAAAVATGSAPSDKTQMQFDVTDGGAQLAFSRYGADYLIEFECRQIDGGETCITEDEAKAFADSLFVAQTR
jgi:hypothetical protein